MKKQLAFISLLTLSANVSAWDFGLKADLQYASTDNVNLTSTAPISDTYSTLGGYLQTKNESLKIKLRGKKEQYTKQKENDNYSADLSLQYIHSKNDDYTFSVFKQAFSGTPLVNTDTTSDNSGGRLSANFSKTYNKDTSGYFTLSGTSKKYPNMSNRTDRIVGSTLGLEHYLTTDFMVTPELILQKDSSTDSYYSSFMYGPTLLISFTPNDNLEFFVDGSYARTTYSGRPISTITRRSSTSEDEYQALISADAGINYTFLNYFTIQVKYTKETNTSNTPLSAYKANMFTFNFNIKY
jgi:hypothetical protein